MPPVRPNRRSWFASITPKRPSTSTTHTIATPSRFAVSSSWMFMRKPPSPENATTVRSGRTSFAAMAPGKAIPIGANPFATITVFGA